MMLMGWVLAPGVLMVGLALVYAGWHRSSRLLSVAGWFGLLGVVPVLAHPVGWEFAVVYVLALPALLVWACIAVEAKTLPDKPVRSRPTMPIDWRGKTALRHLLHGGVVLVLLLALSVAATVSLVQIAPLSPSARVAVAVFLLPTLWASLAWAYLATEYKWRLLFLSLMATVLASTMALR